MEAIVLAELISIAKHSKHVIQVSTRGLVNTLHTNEFVFIQSIKKLQKNDLIEAIFDGDKLYFKLTGLAYEVAA